MAIASGGAIGILGLQVPAVGLALLIAHFSAEDYERVAVAMNILTFLSALDMGANVLMASRVSLPGEQSDDAPVAAVLLTLSPPAVAAGLFVIWPNLPQRLELEDFGLGVLLAVCLVAAIRSCVLLQVIALGTLEHGELQACIGIAGGAIGLAMGAVILYMADSGMLSLLGGLGVGSTIAAVFGVRPLSFRRLLVTSARRWRHGLRLARSSVRLSAGRTLVQVFTSGFILAERSFALHRLSGRLAIEYDIASRVMMTPRQAAAASAPALIHDFAKSRDSISRAATRRQLHRRLAIASVIGMPIALLAICAVAPTGSRAGATTAGGILAIGQAVLLQTLPVTVQLNSDRRAFREAIAYGGGAVVLALAVVTLDPSSPGVMACAVVIAQSVAAATLLAWTLPPGIAE